MNAIRFFILLAVTCSSAAAQLATALDLNMRGNQASDAGSYDEAIRLYREAIKIWSDAGPDYDAHRAGSLLNLAVSVSATGNRPEAARIMEEALALHRKTLGLKNHRTLSNMNLLASNYLMIGDSEHAAALLEEALPIEREQFPNDIQTARTLEGMCNVLIRRGRYADAIAPAEEALTIAIKATGEESLDSALAYSNIGEAHRNVGHPERALPLFRKSRAIYEKALGPNHPRVASLLSQEGLIMMEDGKMATAEALMIKALHAINEGCPNCMVETAIIEHNLAVLRFTQKRYREADELFTHVVALREKFTPTPGKELATTLQLLASVRQKERLYEDARRLNTRANVILGYR
jgi:tetratricopeptide (TPR) repeat protein